MFLIGRMGGWNMPNIIFSPPPSGDYADLDEEKKDKKNKKRGCLFCIISICVVFAMTLLFF